MDCLANLSRSSSTILSAVFFPMPFIPSNVRTSAFVIALANSSGFIYDNMTLAVEAPIPDTFINC